MPKKSTYTYSVLRDWKSADVSYDELTEQDINNLVKRAVCEDYDGEEKHLEDKVMALNVGLSSLVSLLKTKSLLTENEFTILLSSLRNNWL